MKKLLSLVVFCLVAPLSSAAVLHIVDGELVGASGVLINGVLYDVTFHDEVSDGGTGSCLDVFNGCDPSEFAFHTEADAEAAGYALLDQVFIGLHDTNPETVYGCSYTENCLTRIPFDVTLAAVSQVVVVNLSGGSTDFLFPESINIDNPSYWSNVNFAKAVPTPGALILMLIGLVAIAGLGQRNRAVA